MVDGLVEVVGALYTNPTFFHKSKIENGKLKVVLKSKMSNMFSS